MVSVAAKNEQVPDTGGGVLYNAGYIQPVASYSCRPASSGDPVPHMLTFLINILIPIIVLRFLSGDDRLGPIPALLLAIGIPVIFGVYTLGRSHKVNFTTVVGIVSVLLTGTIGLLELDTRYFAIKEGAVPMLFAAFIVMSNQTRFPVVKLLADQVVIRGQVDATLQRLGREAQYQAHLMRTGVYWAGIMALSGFVKFSLASRIVTSPPGTVAFNQDLAHLHAIQVPTSMALTMILMMLLVAYLVRGISRITGLPARETFKGSERLAPFVARLSRR